MGSVFEVRTAMGIMFGRTDGTFLDGLTESFGTESLGFLDIDPNFKKYSARRESLK